MQKYKTLKGEVVEGTVRCSGVRQKFPCSGLGTEVAHSEVTRSNRMGSVTASHDQWASGRVRFLEWWRGDLAFLCTLGARFHL